MAEYTAREWSNGDIVTASNLNQIEDGIENASSGGSEPLVVGMAIEADTPDTGDETYTLDKTWQEIKDAFPNAYVRYEDGSGIIVPILGLRQIEPDSRYLVRVENQLLVESLGSPLPLESASADGYPTYTQSSGV